MTGEEWIDLVDEADRVLGRVTRAQMRRDNLWHRTVMILCLDSRERVYVHRRTPHKDVFPGLYDMFVGGVVGAGEPYDVAAVREIGEELGIVGPEPQFLFRHRYADERSRSHIAVYSVTWGGPITHQPSEVDWGAYFELQEVARNTAGLAYVPDGWEVFQRFIQLRISAPTPR